MKRSILRELVSEVSTESIAQQSGKLHQELTALFEPLLKMTRRQIHDSSFKKDLTKLIKDHFGFSPMVDMGNAHNSEDDPVFCAVYYHPSVTNDAIKKNKLDREFVEEAIKLDYDVKNLRVLGDTSKLPLWLGIDLQRVLSTRYTAPELSAIVIHEIGHYWSGFYFLTRLVRTNLALHSLARGLKEETNPEKRRLVFETISKDSSLPESTFMDIDYTQSAETIISVAGKNLYENMIASELGNPEYSLTMSEHFSDLFAARHGAGKDLVTAFSRGEDELLLWSRMERAKGYYNLVKVVLSTALPTTLGAALISPLVGVLVFIGMGWGSLFYLKRTSTPRSFEWLYDTERDRLKRIRNQVQLRMRILAKDKTKFQIFQEELRVIDELIDRNKNELSSFYKWMTLVFHKSARRRKDQAELEMFFEDLAYNKLYDKALDFKFA